LVAGFKINSGSIISVRIFIIFRKIKFVSVNIIRITNSNRLECQSQVQVSVSFHGREVDLETALDETVRGLQAHLNSVQCNLRTLAADSERDGDFQEMIGEADKLEENIDEMQWLFQDLRGMCYDIVGMAETAEEKAWLKQHKIERKLFFQKRTLEKKAEQKREKSEAKNNMSESKTMED